MAILTISREFGSGGKEIGMEVADTLGYDYVDKTRILSDVGMTGKKWEEWGKDLDEHCPTLWEKFDRSFRGFAALVQASILKYAMKNNVVITGRGGNFLLKDVPHALAVRITASADSRVSRIMERESVDRETAKWLIGKTDGDRACFIRTIYGKEWDNAEWYDMAFDTGNRPPEEIVEILKRELLLREGFRDDAAMKALGLRETAARIRAVILTTPSFHVPTLDVFIEDDFIVVRGVVHSPKEHKRIEDAALEIAGEFRVRCELHYRG
jgi:cytidylate kinase